MATVHITPKTHEAVKLAALMQRKTVSSLVEETLVKHIVKRKEAKHER